MYDVGNKSKIGFWVCAKDKNSALNIALEKGHIKNKNNGNVHDVTTEALSSDRTGTLKPILDGNKEGRLAYRAKSYTLQEVFDGVKKQPKGWMVE